VFPSLSAGDYTVLAMVATFLASFQSPFSSLLGELKDSKSYLYWELLSFVLLVISAVVAVLENEYSFWFLIGGVFFSVWTYVMMILEDEAVTKFSMA
jgi:O-antigen/teichoic acid export membrane protein